VERIEPIRSDRTVPPVQLERLTPVEREQERQRREEQRRRRREAPQDRAPERSSGIDVRI
jgi:hypothetical protein